MEQQGLQLYREDNWEADKVTKKYKNRKSEQGIS